MENRITKKSDKHLLDFKSAIKDWFTQTNSDICGECDKSDFLKFIFDFDSLSFSKDDFQKRKRVKNIVPVAYRCCAKRANGEQCTRRKKDNCDYCGTHEKGRPNGSVETIEIPSKEVKKVEVWVQEIKGINYYIDNEYNVYKHEDILKNLSNPEKLARYTYIDGQYNIPEFGI